MATNNENYVLGRGEIWFKKDGDTAFRFIGNAPTFNLNITSEKLEHFRSTRGVREKDATISLQTNRTANIVAEDINLNNLALFFLGETLSVTQGALTAQTETFNGVKLGYGYQVGVTALRPGGLRRLTTPVLKKGATVLVAGSDYTLDATRGWLEILPGGTLIDGDNVTLEFGVAANKRDQVISGSNSVTGELKFLAYNAEGNNIDYWLPYVEISPNGEYSLISENALQTLPLTLDVQTRGNLAAVYLDGQAVVA